MRAFIAVDLEDDEIIRKLEKVQAELERTRAIMKLVEPRNFHVTLKFLGEIDEKLVDELRKVLEFLTSRRAFEARLVGLGAFPHISRPRVVFVDIDSHELSELMREVDEAVNALGFELERRGYKPHLTIARVKARGYLLKDVINKYRSTEFGYLRVHEVRLKRSKLTPEGPIYSTIFSLKLSE